MTQTTEALTALLRGTAELLDSEELDPCVEEDLRRVHAILLAKLRLVAPFGATADRIEPCPGGGG